MKHLTKGFTIIELLIVVIVIAILATISVVAYNGSQDRAEYAHAVSDMKHINDALLVYKAQNGTYPSTGAAWTFQYPTPNSTARNTSFISALVPKYLDTMPIGKANASYYWFTYAYVSNGIDYKLIRITLPTSTIPAAGAATPAVEYTNNPLIDPARSTWAWGYWTQACAGC